MSRMYLLKLALIWYVFRSAANPAQLEPPLPIDALTMLKKDIPACQKHLAGSIWVRKISPICLRWHSCHTQPFSWRVGGRDFTSRSDGGAWCPGWEEVWSQKSLNLERCKVEDIVAIFTFKVCCRGQWQLPSCSQYSEVKPSPATIISHLWLYVPKCHGIGTNPTTHNPTLIYLARQLGYSCVPKSQCDQGVIVTDGSGILQVCGCTRILDCMIGMQWIQDKEIIWNPEKFLLQARVQEETSVQERSSCPGGRITS